MKIVNRPAVGGALTLAALAPLFFTVLGPDLYDLREKANDPEGRKHIRAGQVIGSVSVLALGAGITIITPGDDRADMLVMFTAILVSGMIAGTYEYALRNPR